MPNSRSTHGFSLSPDATHDTYAELAGIDDIKQGRISNKSILNIAEEEDR